MSSRKYNRERTLLTLLSDGAFHSGGELGESLGVTRAAIWKMMQNLQKRGINIQSVSGKGYRIANGLCFLDKDRIEEQLSQQARETLDRIDCFDQIESTNDYLLKQAQPKTANTIACFAEQQTAGKGRRGREWLSPYANNIYHSLLWWFDKDSSELLGLSLAVAVSVARALKKFGINDGLELKWPNDINWRSQKLGGILVELLAEPHQRCAVIIGIGINTRLTIQQSLDRPITSTEDILQKPSDRNALAALLLNELLPGLESFQESGLESFLEEWNALDAFRNKPVTLSSPQQTITGIMKGISQNGALILEDASGKESQYVSGEMSLRGSVTMTSSTSNNE